MKTTDERPHLPRKRGLPERGGSPIGLLRTVLAQRLSSPHPSASLATASKAPCKALFPDSSRFPSPASRARPRFPSQAGTSCEAGASTARTRDGQPSPSGNHGRSGRERAESTPVSRRSQHPTQVPRRPSGIPSSRTRAFKAAAYRLAFKASSKAGPIRCSQIKGPPNSAVRSHRTPHTPPSCELQTRHPRSLCTL